VETSAALRIFAIPYAGASSYLYRGWQRQMPSGIQLCPIQLPGRGKRAGERACSQMDELIEGMYEGLAPHLEQPFALFGHSMGGLIAFALAHRLETQFGLRSVALVVAGCSPPHVKRNSVKLHEWSDEDLIAELWQRGGTPKEVLSCAPIMRVMLPLIRADFELIYNYRTDPEIYIEGPIYGFAGSNDVEDGPASMHRWKEVTTNDFRLSVIPGGHLFPFSASAAFMSVFRPLAADLVNRAQQSMSKPKIQPVADAEVTSY
jgi:medium-chain acyl-[acyl-carrier-protein] hydrolase